MVAFFSILIRVDIRFIVTLILLYSSDDSHHAFQDPISLFLSSSLYLGPSPPAQRSYLIFHLQGRRRSLRNHRRGYHDLPKGTPEDLGCSLAHCST